MPEVHAAILDPPCSIAMITGKDAMMHWHNFPQIWYVLRGEILHTVGKETCNAKEGSCIFVPMFCPHGTLDASADSEVVSISFASGLLSNAGDDVFLLGETPHVSGRRIEFFTHLEGKQRCEFSELVSALKTECQKNGGKITSKIALLLLRMLKRMSSDGEVNKPTKAEKRRIAEITEVVDYAAEEISEKMTIEGICSSLDISRAAFVRNFKKITGTSFAKMLTLMRVRYTCIQLARTDKKMVQIAGETGFYDESHLTHAFFENTGKTPTQYQKETTSLFDDICIFCEDAPRNLRLTSKRKKRIKTVSK